MNATMMQTILDDSTNVITIISGEGNVGRVVPFTGKRTVRAIKSRLTRERCGGDRWADVQINYQTVQIDG